MNRREAAIIEAYTGYVTLRNDSRECVYQYASELLGRRINALEYAREDIKTQLHSLARKDYNALFERL